MQVPGAAAAPAVKPMIPGGNPAAPAKPAIAPPATGMAAPKPPVGNAFGGAQKVGSGNRRILTLMLNGFQKASMMKSAAAKALEKKGGKIPPQFKEHMKKKNPMPAEKPVKPKEEKAASIAAPSVPLPSKKKPNTPGAATDGGVTQSKTASLREIVKTATAKNSSKAAATILNLIKKAALAKPMTDKMYETLVKSASAEDHLAAVGMMIGYLGQRVPAESAFQKVANDRKMDVRIVKRAYFKKIAAEFKQAAGDPMHPFAGMTGRAAAPAAPSNIATDLASLNLGGGIRNAFNYMKPALKPALGIGALMYAPQLMHGLGNFIRDPLGYGYNDYHAPAEDRDLYRSIYGEALRNRHLSSNLQALAGAYGPSPNPWGSSAPHGMPGMAGMMPRAF